MGYFILMGPSHRPIWNQKEIASYNAISFSPLIYYHCLYESPSLGIKFIEELFMSVLLSAYDIVIDRYYMEALDKQD